MLVETIKAEIDISRLTDLLANDYLQESARELKESIESIGGKEND